MIFVLIALLLVAAPAWGQVCDATPPSNGTLVATAGDTNVALSWSGFTDSGVGLACTNTYKLVFATTTPPANCSSGSTLVTGTGTSFNHTGLTNGTVYGYRVCATDNVGNVSTGATASATPVAGDTTAPVGTIAINSNAAYTSSVSATLNLSATDAVGVTGYFISTSSTPPLAATPGWVTVGPTTSYNANVAYTLAAGDGTKTVYAWYKDAVGNVSATKSDTIVLDQTAPVNGTLTPTAGDTQVALSWSGFSDATSGLASANTYKLVYALTTAPANCSSGTTLLTGTGTSFNHTGLSNGTTYGYRVCATDNAGNVSTGATATAQPAAGPPPTQDVYSKHAGSTTDDRGSAVAADASLNAFATGHFSGTVNFGGSDLTVGGANAQNAYLVKYGPTGTHLWSTRFAGTSFDRGLGVKADSSGNVVVVGTRQSPTVDYGCGNTFGQSGTDGFVAKFNSSGTCQWSKVLGGFGGDSATAVAIDSSGNVIVVGYFDVSISGVTFGGSTFNSRGVTDVFVVKYSSTGTHLWSKQLGGTSFDGAYAVAVNSSGDVFVTGYFQGTANFGGTDLVSAGSNDIFLVKLAAADGAHSWSKRFGGTTSDVPYGLVVDSSGNPYIAGSFTGSVDFGGGALVSAGADDIFLAKYSGTDGSHVWSKRLGSTGSDVAYGLSIDSNNVLGITGYFNGIVDFGGGNVASAGSYDVFLARYNSSGTYQSAKRFGGSQVQIGTGVAAIGVNYLITGYYQVGIDLGQGVMSNAGGYDIYIGEVTP